MWNDWIPDGWEFLVFLTIIAVFLLIGGCTKVYVFPGPGAWNGPPFPLLPPPMMQEQTGECTAPGGIILEENENYA